jgi:hypothetical protein
MPAYPANLGPISFRSIQRQCLVVYKGQGPYTLHNEKGALPNPATDLGSPWAARIFVGFKVGNKTKWTMKSVIKVVWEERKKQGRQSGASFLSQQGIYEVGGKRIVEPSAQIVIFDFDGLGEKAFVEDMTKLGEALCRRLEQQEVIVEIQKAGVVKKTLSVVQ